MKTKTTTMKVIMMTIMMMVGITANAKTTIVINQHDAHHPVTMMHAHKPCNCHACKKARKHEAKKHKMMCKHDCKMCKQQMPPRRPMPKGMKSHKPQGHRK